MTNTFLKFTARKAYRLFYEELDRYDCGIELAKEVNPRIAEAARDFNEAMDQLARIDPTAPKVRL